jgi:site-specific recombinase XerD
MNIHEAIEQCLISANAIRAKNTARAYNNGLVTLEAYLETRLSPYPAPLEQLSIEHLVLYPEWLAAQGYAKKTISTYIAGVVFFIRWLVLRDYLKPTYSESIKIQEAMQIVRSKRETRLPRFPARDAADKMIEAVRVMSEESPRKERNIALILFLASTGCRNNEIVQLRVKDLDMQDCSTVVIGKASKERRVWFSQSAANALGLYWRARGWSNGNDPVFARHDRGVGEKHKPITTSTTRTIVDNVSAIAGIEEFTPHYFRHAFAIKMLAETHDLALVQDLLGHTNPAATRVYAKIYPEDLQRAHRDVFK